MTVSVWVPIAVALITATAAAVPVIYSVRSSRRDTQTTQQSKELELVVTGLTALVNALQEQVQVVQGERAAYAADLHECRRQLERVLAS
jgi:hypothetical protein